jgi:hypothetical protein
MKIYKFLLTSILSSNEGEEEQITPPSVKGAGGIFRFTFIFGPLK